MIKKALIGSAGLLLIGVLLFGGKLVPYAQTAYNGVTEAVNDSVPIDFQIKAARTQMKNIGPEIRKMVQQIATEQAEVGSLQRQYEKQANLLEKQYDEMMARRAHLESDESVYVTTNGRAYTNEQIAQDLEHRFSLYQTAEQTQEKSLQIIDSRKQALENARTKLDMAKASQRELAVQIENLTARERLIEVTRQANDLSIDNTQLTRTQNMVDHLNTRLDAEEIVISMEAPGSFGLIPDSQVTSDKGDILDRMDDYFSDKVESEIVVKK